MSLPGRSSLSRQCSRTLCMERSDSEDSLAAEALMSLGEGDTQSDGGGRTKSTKLRATHSISRFTPQSELAMAASVSQVSPCTLI